MADGKANNTQYKYNIPVSELNEYVTLPNIIAASIACGTAFQIGYFVGLGTPSYFSMASIQDWVFGSFVIGLVLIILFIATSLIAALISYCQKKGKDISKALFIIFTFIWIPNSIVVLSYSSSNPVLAMAIGGPFLILCTSLGVGFELAKRKSLSRPMLYMSSLTTLFLMLGAGAIFSMYLDGTTCTLIATDNKVERGLYMRTLGDGHIFRVDGRTIFIPKDKVLEINCPAHPGSLQPKG